MTNLISAVAYYRMSSDRQETSIPAQRVEVAAYAQKHSYHVIREYKDEGISGDKTEKRIEFQKMIADAKEKGDFEVILCWDQDRFGRFDPLEAGYWTKPLRDVGVRLETVAQGRINWDDFAGRIIYAVQQEGKHAFLRDLSRNVVRGMLRNAKEGKFNGGPVPYAMSVQDGRLVPGDLEEVRVVQWLFQTYAAGQMSLGQMADELNRQGMPSPAGMRWHKTVVHKLLARPYYAGDAVWNRRTEGKYFGVQQGEIQPRARRTKRKHWGNPSEDWQRKEASITPIVDRETFERVQERLASNCQNKTPHRGGGDFLFTGLVRCANCGAPMHGCTNVQKDKDRHGRVRSAKTYTYRRYICGAYNSHGKLSCQCNTIPERQLLHAVVKRIQDDFLNPTNLEKLEEELRRQASAKTPADSSQAKRLAAQIAKLDEQIDKGNERLLIIPDDLFAGASAKVRAWQEERERLRKELTQVKDTAAEPDRDIEQDVKKALACLRTLQEQLAHGGPPIEVREVIRQMVSRIECWFEQVPYGQKGRTCSRLTRGLIHLRPDRLVIRDVPSGRPLITVYPARTKSVAKFSATRRP
jgi:DNA invertase Pin-like site-specific DNA recombinase